MRPVWKRLSFAVLTLCLPALASPPVALSYSLTSPEWGDATMLKLADGRTIEGRYHGMLGVPSDSGRYAERYESWRNEVGPATAPALRDSLIVFRAPGGLLRGRFGGIAGHALLLGTVDTCTYLFIPLENIAAVRLAEYVPADSIWTDIERWRSAPSQCATILQRDFETIAVPEDLIVASRSTADGGGGNGGGSGAGTGAIVILAVLVGAAIGYYAAAAAVASAFSHLLI